MQVLRFYCVWDDRQALYGDRRPYRLHYFLEDDTVEILELHENNDGRDPFPVFLRRGPLPKVRAYHSCMLSQLCSPLAHTLSLFLPPPSRRPAALPRYSNTLTYRLLQ